MSVEVSEQKSIEKVVTGMPTSDGAGVSLTRIIGQPELPRLEGPHSASPSRQHPPELPQNRQGPKQTPRRGPASPW